MNPNIQIKIHNVRHEKSKYDKSRAEEYISDYIIGADVVDVRIASGPKNSPLFITVDADSVSVNRSKDISRQALRGFSQFVNGIDIRKSISDDNILVTVSKDKADV
jgi:hypothetical protein